MQLILDRMTLGRPFIAPPGIPADRLALLRDAFQKAVEDPELRADAEKQKLAIDPTWGAEAEAVIQRLYATPPSMSAIGPQKRKSADRVIERTVATSEQT